jgi:hypothetical protein
VDNDAAADSGFGVIPKEEHGVFANGQVTPEQLASAARVRERGLNREVEAIRILDAHPQIGEPPPAQSRID